MCVWVCYSFMLKQLNGFGYNLICRQLLFLIIPRCFNYVREISKTGKVYFIISFRFPGRVRLTACCFRVYVSSCLNHSIVSDQRPIGAEVQCRNLYIYMERAV